MKNQSTSKCAALLGKTRAARAISISSISLLLALAVLIAANLLFGLLPVSLTKPNVTGSETFRISGKTTDQLGALDEDVTLYLICNGGKKAADNDLIFFLSHYAEASTHVKVEVVDSSLDDEFVNTHGGTWPSDMSIVVESARRYKTIDVVDLYYYLYSDDSLGSIKLTHTDYEYLMQGLAEDDPTGQSAALFVAKITPYFDGESRVTNAINYVTLERVATTYALTGNGCTALDAAFTEYVSDASFDLLELPSLAAIPADCDVLLMNAPATDLSDGEASALSAYLAGGGKLFLTTAYDKTALPNLASVLKTYGLGFAEKQHLICEGNTNYLLSATVPYFFEAHLTVDHPITSAFDGAVIASSAHAIETFDTDGVKHEKLLYTSMLGYTYDTSAKAQVGEKGEFVFGVSAQKGASEIIWIADSGLMNSQINTYSSNGNFDLILTSLNHLSGVSSDSITVSARVVETPVLAVTSAQFLVLGVILILILPVAVGAIGVGIWYVRKKR